MRAISQRLIVAIGFSLVCVVPLSAVDLNGTAGAIAQGTIPAPRDKRTQQAAVAKSDQFAYDQAQAIKKIPGEDITAADLKQQSKKHMDVNPMDWVFGPVIKMEKQSVKLEQDILKLTGPIAALQPGMLGLEKRITSVQDKMDVVDDKLGHVQQQMQGLQQDVRAMRNELGEIRQPVTELRQPILDIKKPILDIVQPISSVGRHLTAVDQEIKDLRTLIGLVLTSIFIAAGLIAVGTPLAAILVWRNRAKLLPPPKPHEAAEEASIARASRTMAGQLRR